MPHFGLIEEDMVPEAEVLLRAKLHMRGGDIRMKRGELADAIASYYDAFSSAILRFYLSDRLRKEYNLPDLSDITDDHAVFLALKANGVIDDTFTDINFHQTETLLDAAFAGWAENYDYQSVIDRLVNVMNQLKVLPIIPGELPEENATTL
ncbi:MAG: hypothetical protein ACW98Y_14535 [Candidatus Thorarchaeota archaeon]